MVITINELKDRLTALPPSEETKPIMKDSDLREVLEKIASQINTSVVSKTNQPYSGMRRMSSQGEDRKWDKIYTIGGLDVLVEAKLGMKKHPKPGVKIKYIVTPEQQESNEAMGVNFGIGYIAGPLVDNEQDTELKTIRVMNILAQYSGITLDRFGKGWDGFIENVRKSYGVEIGDKSGDIKKPSLVSSKGGLILSEEQRIEYNPTMVFQAEIKSREDLGKLCNVLNAGLIVQEVYVDETRKLSKHLRNFNPISINHL